MPLIKIGEKRPRQIAPYPQPWAHENTEWILSDWFCPECGLKDTMWQETSDLGDFYEGFKVTCFSCQHEMSGVAQVIDPPPPPWWDTVD